MKSRQLIQKLLAYSKDATDLAAKELASRLNKDTVSEWLHADNNVPTNHHYTNSENVHIVVSPEKNGSEEGSRDENEKVLFINLFCSESDKSST